MSNGLKLIWMVTLLLFIAGCGTYKRASWPNMENPRPTEESPTIVVEAGDRVRLEMLDRSSLQGILQAGNADSFDLRVQRSVNDDISFGTRSVPRDSILVIEKYVSDKAATGAVLVVTIGTIVGAAVFANNFTILGN